MKSLLFRWMTELTSIPFVSKLTGGFAKSSLSKRMIPTFANLYKINVAEAEFPLSHYASLNDFFTRRLKKGARTIDTTSEALVSPVDARITSIGIIESNTLLNVKGQTYKASEIINHPTFQSQFINGHYIVLYLSPTDYHRIHAPVSGDWIGDCHTTGAVLPVHDPALTHVPQVLSRNERLTTVIGTIFGDVAVIKVGAMNVASIQYACEKGAPVLKGSELAYFEFGSTVVLFVSSTKYQFEWIEGLSEGMKVKLGQRLGSWKANE